MSDTPVVIVSIEPLVAAAAAVVVGSFTLALWARSWTWWLAGYGATLITLVLLWGTR